MAPGAHEPYDVVFRIESIHQQPITLDMKFTILGESALKLMIAILRRKYLYVILFQRC